MSEDEERPPPTPDLGGATVKPRNSATNTVTAPLGDLSCYVSPNPDQVLENVLENVLCFLTSRRDRNAASLVCKSWYRAEALTRSELFIGNCYAVAPRRVINRFKRVNSVAIKGRPRFADFSLLPPDWGAHFGPWVNSMAEAYGGLEKVYLKRMSLTDNDLAVLARSFPNFKELVLVCCDGFGTAGLAIVADGCRKIRVLDLIECELADDDVDWISCFPDNGTCLESLLFDCVDTPINFEALERLVVRSRALKKLRLNRSVSIGQLYRLMVGAPQLTHLGTGSFSPFEFVAQGETEPDYVSAFSACKSLVCLSGFRDIGADYLPAIIPVCANLTSLNLSYANINTEQLKSVICHCHKLQTFWVLDSVCDEGLQAVAATCKDLRELRVFPLNPQEDVEGPVSEVGLLAISEGCRKLQSILYFCQRMTNAAVIAMSKNCPDLVVFRLCIMGRHRPDHTTSEPMDEGFGAIVKNCKKLTRLAVSGLLTDKAFGYIGQYGKLVRTLSVAFAGDSDMGLKYVLVKMQYPPSGPGGRSQFGNRVTSGGHASEPAEAGSFNSLIGRKVWTRWPDDNNFYEALITDYNALEGLHALVYDMGTTNETWEWVNLSEISPEDIKWDGEDPGISHHGGFAGPGHGMNRPVGREGGPGAGRGRGMSKSLAHKDFPPSQNGIGKKGSDDIQLLHTDTLIKEVERVFSSNHPDPLEIEKAKKVLKEHEQALAEAIARLAEISDGESDGGGHFLHGQSMDRE